MVSAVIGLTPLAAKASAYVPLGDWTDHVYRNVPFEIYGAVLDTWNTPDNPDLDPDTNLWAWWDLSPCGTAKRLHIIQHCAWADNVPTGVTVGHITVFYEDDSTSTCDLVVGKNTAEWSYDKPDLQPCLQHHKVQPAYSSPVDDDKDGIPEYYGHLFYVSIKLDDKPLDSVELDLDVASYTNPDWTYGCAPWDWFGISILAITVEYPGAPPKDPKEALVGHWKLDEKKGPIAYDSSGNQNHGVVYGDAVWQPKAGVLRGALSFDGVDDYVELPIGGLVSQLTSCSIMSWVNWSGEYSWQRVFDFGSGGDANMFLTPLSGEGCESTRPYDMRFAITLGGGCSEERACALEDQGLPRDGWHHVVVTIDADEGVATLYLDGEPVGENAEMTLTPSDLGVTTQNWLGRSQYESDSLYAGSLDDFRIYNRALSQAEIQVIQAETQ